MALLFGWLGPLNGTFAWYANPLLFLSLAWTKKRTRSALVLAILATLLGLTTFLMTEIVSDSGGPTPIGGFGSGVYVWLLSLLSGTLAAALSLIQKKDPIVRELDAK
jgi:hypothetical protein